MFTVVFISQGAAGNSTVIVYGPFSTYQAAEAWIASQQQPANYLVASAWGTTPSGTPSVLPPATGLAVGSNVVLFIGQGINGYVCYVYGPFATPALAAGYVAQFISPQSYTVTQIAQPF